MNSEPIARPAAGVLSAAWIFVLFNVLFRDVHQLFAPGMLAAMAAGTVNGVPVTDLTLLLGGVALEVPIAMVLLSRLLPGRVSRWANVVAALVSVPLLLSTPPTDLDDWFFTAAEVAGLVLIVWAAWTWRPTGRPVRA